MKLIYNISYVFYSLKYEFYFFIAFIVLKFNLNYKIKDKLLDFIALKLDKHLVKFETTRKFGYRNNLHYNIFFELISKNIYLLNDHRIAVRYFIYMLSEYKNSLLTHKYVYSSKVLIEKSNKIV